MIYDHVSTSGEIKLQRVTSTFTLNARSAFWHTPRELPGALDQQQTVQGGPACTAPPLALHHRAKEKQTLRTKRDLQMLPNSWHICNEWDTVLAQLGCVANSG